MPQGPVLAVWPSLSNTQPRSPFPWFFEAHTRTHIRQSFLCKAEPIVQRAGVPWHHHASSWDRRGSHAMVSSPACARTPPHAAQVNAHAGIRVPTLRGGSPYWLCDCPGHHTCRGLPSVSLSREDPWAAASGPLMTEEDWGGTQSISRAPLVAPLASWFLSPGILKQWQMTTSSQSYWAQSDELSN